MLQNHYYVKRLIKNSFATDLLAAPSVEEMGNLFLSSFHFHEIPTTWYLTGVLHPISAPEGLIIGQIYIIIFNATANFRHKLSTEPFRGEGRQGMYFDDVIYFHFNFCNTQL